jgi:hypothetical protein
MGFGSTLSNFTTLAWAAPAVLVHASVCLKHSSVLLSVIRLNIAPVWMKAVVRGEASRGECGETGLDADVVRAACAVAVKKMYMDDTAEETISCVENIVTLLEHAQSPAMALQSCLSRELVSAGFSEGASERTSSELLAALKSSDLEKAEKLTNAWEKLLNEEGSAKALNEIKEAIKGIDALLLDAGTPWAYFDAAGPGGNFKTFVARHVFDGLKARVNLELSRNDIPFSDPELDGKDADTVNSRRKRAAERTANDLVDSLFPVTARSHQWIRMVESIDQIKKAALEDTNCLKTKWGEGGNAMAYQLEPNDSIARGELLKAADEAFDTVKLLSAASSFSCKHLSEAKVKATLTQTEDESGVVVDKLLYAVADLSASACEMYRIGGAAGEGEGKEGGVAVILKKVFEAEKNEEVTALLQKAAESVKLFPEPLLVFRRNMCLLVDLPHEAETILTENLRVLAEDESVNAGLVRDCLHDLCEMEDWKRFRGLIIGGSQDVPDEVVKGVVEEVSSIVGVISKHSKSIGDGKRAGKEAIETLKLGKAVACGEGGVRLGDLPDALYRFAEKANRLSSSADGLVGEVEAGMKEKGGLHYTRRAVARARGGEGEEGVVEKQVENMRDGLHSTLKKSAAISAAQAFVLRHTHEEAEEAFEKLAAGMEEMRDALYCCKTFVAKTEAEAEDRVVARKKSRGEVDATHLSAKAKLAVSAFWRGDMESTAEHKKALLDALEFAFEKFHVVATLGSHLPLAMKASSRAGEKIEAELAGGEYTNEFGEIEVVTSAKGQVDSALTEWKAFFEDWNVMKWLEQDSKSVVKKVGVRSRGSALFELVVGGRRDFMEDDGVRTISLYVGSLVSGLVMLPAGMTLVVAALEVLHSARGAGGGKFEVIATQVYMSREAGGEGAAMSTVLPLGLPFAFVFGAAAGLGVGVRDTLLRVLKKRRERGMMLVFVVLCAVLLGYTFGAAATAGSPEVEMAATAAVAVLGAGLLAFGALGIKVKIVENIDRVFEVVKGVAE